MASFLTRAAMADRIYEQQQKEREDREFELFKRKHEQEEMERKAYLAPFETKETLAQYEDADNERQGKKNQQLAWMSPYRPSVEVADDGTRKVGAEMPTSLVLENLMAAAGPGFQSDYITPFAKAAPDAIGKATLDVKETPEEAKNRAEAEAEHKRALELAKARNAATRRSSSKNSSGSSSDSLTKQYLGLVKKAYEQNEAEFQSKFQRRPTDEEIKELSARAVSAAKVQMDAMYSQPAATTPTQKPAPKPAASKKAGTSPTPDDDPFAKHEQFKNDAVTTPPPPPTQTVNLKDKQAANVATPVAAPYVQPLPISIPQNTPQHVADLLKIVEGNWPSIAADNGFSNEDRDLFAQILIETANNPQLQRIQQRQAWDPTGQAKSLHDSIFQSALMEFRKRRFAASQQPFDVQAAQAKFQDAVKNRLPSYRR